MKRLGCQAGADERPSIGSLQQLQEKDLGSVILLSDFKGKEKGNLPLCR